MGSKSHLTLKDRLYFIKKHTGVQQDCCHQVKRLFLLIGLRVTYAQIQTGLLPNLATKADSLRENYDIHTANLESDSTLLGLGLIGFRPRQYMQNLNLDDISQAGLYSQFLRNKRHITAAETFTSANLGKEEAEYEIFENWAIQRGIYGANANRSYFELRTDESKLLSNPSTIAVIDPGEISTANQTVLGRKYLETKL